MATQRIGGTGRQSSGSRRRWWALVALVGVSLLGCQESTEGEAAAGTTSSPGASPANQPTTSQVFVGPTSTMGVTATPVPGAEGSTTQPAVFRFEIAQIDDDLAARMVASWRPSCPVGLDQLRYVTVSHFDFDGGIAEGELVVHADVADQVVAVFDRLFDDRFPVESMRLVDDYDADDHASMLANNTSAFNCREVAGRPGVLSQHAYGTAIDINPRVNPWVGSGFVDPPESAAYADRTQRVPGGIYAGDPVVEAFRDIGWQWGGEWADSKDWQHFAAAR